MAKKSLGYVNLEWTCPFCGTRNKGTDTVCVNCGAPQPDDVQFEQAAQDEWVTDAAVIERAKKGADIHCPYCGTRNPADAKICSQCDGDLSEDAVRRARGRILGAYKGEPAPDVKCPSCGAMNPATAQQCSQCGAPLPLPAAPPPKAEPAAPPAKSGPPRWLLAVGALLFLCLCAGLAYLMFSTNDARGTVQDVEWEYAIGIEAQQPVEYQNWQDQVPAGAEILTCFDEVRYVEENPVPNAVEVCGTPYTVDTGSGVGEVVQDCQYQVYDAMCRYTVLEWQEVDRAVASGRDFQPDWPAVALAAGQREGERNATFIVIFQADGKNYTYKPGSLEEFRQFQPGSTWTLTVNKLGNVVDVEP